MYIEKEYENSYLSMNEFVYHASIIGFGMGLINMFHSWINLSTDGASIEIILFTLIIPITHFIYGIFAGILIFPLYSYYAKNKGGLRIVIRTKEEDKGIEST